MASIGGLGGLGGWDPGLLMGALGQSLLTSPREAPLAGLPAGIQAVNQRQQEAAQQAAMLTVAKQLGIDPSIAVNPKAMEMLVAYQNKQKSLGLAQQAMGAMGSLVPPSEAGAVTGMGTAPVQRTPSMIQGGSSAAKQLPADPALAPAILKYATAAGLDPVDVATAMSYETGGTFDPWKAGPTTQWGQHRGLIQWGEPQAKQYGVSKDTPVEQQVAASIKYLQDRGVKPGMGLMDIYSAINAGSVGRNNASDANNGGAPGTVADKVNNQMAAHRQKAAALLGQSASSEGLPTQPYQVASSGRTPVPTTPLGIPAKPPEGTGATTMKAWATNAFGRSLQLMVAGGGLGEDGKGIVEAAKAANELAKVHLTPDERMKRLEAAGVDPRSELGRDVLTDGMRFKGEEQALNKDKFDYERYKTDRAYRFEVDNAERTTGTKEYDAYAKQERAAGRDPVSRMDYAVKLARAGSPQPEGVEDVKRAESVTKFLDSHATKAPVLAQRSADLDMLGKIVTKTATSRGATLKAYLDGAAAELGLSKGTLATQKDAIDAITQRIAPSLRDPGSGAQSDSELRGFLSSLPGLTQTPEGNQLIGATLKRAAAIDNERSSIAAQWQAGKLTATAAREKIAELDGKSIYASPEEKALVDRVMGGLKDQVAPTAEPKLIWVPGKGLQRQ